MGDIVNDPSSKKDFYLVIQQGRYACGSCSTPGPPAKPPHGTVETSVWSPNSDIGDWGIGTKLPATMSHLHPIAVITIS